MHAVKAQFSIEEQFSVGWTDQIFRISVYLFLELKLIVMTPNLVQKLEQKI